MLKEMFQPETQIEKKIKIIEISQEKFSDIEAFSSDNSSMNNFLKEEAYYQHISFNASTMLVYSEEKLVGFFTLTQSEIKFDDTVLHRPCLDLARLAVDSDFQFKGIGSHIIKYIINLARIVNQRYITLDSLFNKWEWYNRRGFVNLVEDEIDESKNQSGFVYMLLDLYDPDSVDEYFNE